MAQMNAQLALHDDAVQRGFSLAAAALPAPASKPVNSPAWRHWFLNAKKGLNFLRSSQAYLSNETRLILPEEAVHRRQQAISSHFHRQKEVVGGLSLVNAFTRLSDPRLRRLVSRQKSEAFTLALRCPNCGLVTLSKRADDTTHRCSSIKG